MAQGLYADNERWWSERASFHLDTEMYREFVARLRAGKDSLLPFDDRVLGDLTGLEVLHLQCHVGTDTLSLARRGARVTGLDFSAEAVVKARQLSGDLGISATFVQGNAVDLPHELRGPFDLIYTSYGALCWLGDLRAWAGGIAPRLRAGGRLVVIDTHPLCNAIVDARVGGETLTLAHPYLDTGSAECWDDPGSYADRNAATKHNRAHEWSHGLGDVVGAVLEVGLVLEALSEHPEGYCPFVEGMIRGEDRLWRLPQRLHGRYPLTFTIVARKP